MKHLLNSVDNLLSVRTIGRLSCFVLEVPSTRSLSIFVNPTQFQTKYIPVFDQKWLNKQSQSHRALHKWSLNLNNNTSVLHTRPHIHEKKHLFGNMRTRLKTQSIVMQIQALHLITQRKTLLNSHWPRQRALFSLFSPLQVAKLLENDWLSGLKAAVKKTTLLSFATINRLSQGF